MLGMPVWWSRAPTSPPPLLPPGYRPLTEEEARAIPKEIPWTVPGARPDMMVYRPDLRAVVADPSNSRWDDPEPHEDPRQLEFDFEFPEPLDPSGVPTG